MTLKQMSGSEVETSESDAAADSFDEDCDVNEKQPADVSHHTLEQKIVAAVWVHERVANNQTWPVIMKNFKARFKSKPPSKQTLLCWERKLFTTGNAHDRTRTGRPIARLMHVPYVKQSIEESPNLSIRERARELGIPYATLVKIIKDDLKMAYIEPEKSPTESKIGIRPGTSGQWKLVNNSSKSKKKSVITSTETKIDTEDQIDETKKNITSTSDQNNIGPASFGYEIHNMNNVNSISPQIQPMPMASMYQNYDASTSHLY